MSRLQGKLSRRRQRADNDGQREQQIDEPEAPLEQPVSPNEKTGEVAGSKSDIIAQLQRRMEKIQQQPVKAFGTGNRKPRINSDWPAPEDVPETEIPDEANVPDYSITVQPEPLLPGGVLDTEMGEIWQHRQTYPGYFHGNAPVNRFLSVGPAMGVFAKDNRLSAMPPEGALFIDTETTGLSSGAGTLAFLIGCGFFEDGVFVVEQYFCREPAEEPAQLAALANRLARASYLVSFNGKAFDIPLINTRFILNRTKNPAYNLPHLDLLHVCRRIFKRRLNDRSLQNLERVLLGFTREGDIPGALIPEAYRDYLFGHGEDRIAAILEHNQLDIVALAALGGMLDEIYNDPRAVAHAADHLGLAKEAFGAGETFIGDWHLNAADDEGMADDRKVALHMKARETLRRRLYSQAATLYHEILGMDEADGLAHLQLAKLYEHRLKDYDRALHHAGAVSELEGDDATEHRMKRIEKKRSKYAGRK